MGRKRFLPISLFLLQYLVKVSTMICNAISLRNTQLHSWVFSINQ